MKKFLIILILFLFPIPFLSTGCTNDLNDSGSIVVPSDNNNNEESNNPTIEENETEDDEKNIPDEPGEISPGQDNNLTDEETNNNEDNNTQEDETLNEEDSNQIVDLENLIEWKNLIVSTLIQYNYLKTSDNVTLSNITTGARIEATRENNFSLEDIGMINFLLRETLKDMPYQYEMAINLNVLSIIITK